jgi:flagellar assembly protein FliH
VSRIITRTDTGAAHGPLPAAWRESTARMAEAAGARARAAAMLLNARAQAREIITAAQAAGREVAQAERQHAWESGYAEGMEQARRDMAMIAQRLAALVTNAAIAHEASLRNRDEELLALALAMTRAIVRHEVQTAPETILAVARAALQEMSIEHSVLLRVHPDDAAVIEAQLPALGLPPSVHVSVVADAALSPGGCQVEGGASRVDGRIETQLARMESLLHEHL